MSRDRRPTKEELDLWQRVTADVDRLSPKMATTKPATRQIVPEKKRLQANRRQPASLLRPTSQPKAASPLPFDPQGPLNTDRRTFEKLKRGKMAVDGRLDLHGRTQREAHDALGRFLEAAVARRFRCILVVTGKGYDGNGILRQMVPKWLAEPDNRQRVVTYCTAQSRHGGDGALYVLVRRTRS